MKKINNLAISMLMSICAAATFTACSDDTISDGNSNNNMPEGAQTALLEPYGLTFENFTAENDVQILNADTTEISVSKALAEKLGIKTFVNHPLGIWHTESQLPYARKATAEKLVGDRYILTVQPATVAEMIGNKKVTLNTNIFINPNANGESATRADGMVMPGYAAKYMDEDDVIHPAVVHMTDPYGYNKGYHTDDDQPTAGTRADGNFQYMTAEELAQGGTRASVRRNILSFNDKLEFDKNFQCGLTDDDSVNVNMVAPINFELNYFITLDGGIKWTSVVPSPYVQKFEAGLDGKFAFSPKLLVSFEGEWKLDKDRWKMNLISFSGYTFTFWVGPVPVCIQCTPNLYMKLDGKVSAEAQVGVKYEYENNFKGGVRYEDDYGWSTIGEFNEVKNDLEFIKPKAQVKAEAAFGLFLGMDVMIYGVGGPQVGVGPNLSAEAEMSLSPFAENYDERANFKAEVKLTVNAEVGAKLELLGYTIGEFSKTIALAGPWTLFKYPSDGSEHVTGSENVISAEWLKVFEATQQSYTTYDTYMNESVSMLCDMKGIDAEAAKKEIMQAVMLGYRRVPEIKYDYLERIIAKMHYNWDELKKEYAEFEWQREAEKGNIEWMNARNWHNICEEMKHNVVGAYKLSWFDSISDELHQWFLEEFKREPSMASKEDMQWIVMHENRYYYYKNMRLDAEAAQQKAATEQQEETKEASTSIDPWIETLELLKAQNSDYFETEPSLSLSAANAVHKSFRNSFEREPDTSDIAELTTMFRKTMSRYISRNHKKN